MLGQMLAPGSLNPGNALAGTDQVFEGTSFDRVQLTQVHDRFRQVDGHGRGRQEIPAKDQTTTNLVSDGLGLENVPRD
jgi:hypothetical protein